MAVLVKNNLQVDTNILTQSMNMVVNSVMEILVEIIFIRKLDPADLLRRRKSLEDAMFVWLLERTLRGVIFEVSLPASSNALEQWDVAFAYSDSPDSQVKRAPTEELKRFGETLKALPPGSSFNIIVRLAPNAKDVPGWVSATKKNINPTVEKNFGTFGYGTIAGELRYTGGIL
jgi:hypothetical protein